MNDQKEIKIQNSVPPSEAASILAMIERIVLDKDVDITKLEKMLDLQERILNRNAVQAFSADFAAMQLELQRVNKNGLIQIKKDGRIIQETSFAKLEDINDTIRPTLHKYGFGVSFSISQTNTLVTVTAKLMHRLGHSDITSISLPIDTTGSKNAVQGIGSTTAYGKRYTLCAILNISTGDDIDGNKPIEPEQLTLGEEAMKKIRDALFVADYNEASFCRAAGIQKLEDMLLSRMDTAIEFIKSKTIILESTNDNN